MMMVQQPPPRPQHIKHFCPHLQIESIGVLRRNGQYYFYCFDYTKSQFQPLECLGCQPMVTEQHLYPLYAEYCKDLNNYVCFAFNNLSLKVEQFVFHQRTGGLEEVNRPELVHDIRKPLADILCVVKETEEFGMVIIQRDQFQNFKKSRAYENQFVSLPPMLIKTLMLKKVENFMLTPSEAEMFRPPSSSKSGIFVFQYCPAYQGIGLICVRQEDNSYLRFYFSEQSGLFHLAKCRECTGPLTENGLRPYYAIYSKAIRDHVIFVENLLNFQIEQYVFCRKTWGFKQVEDSELVFEEKLVDSISVILKVSTSKGMIYLSKNRNGFMDKYIFTDDEKYEKIAPKEVKTLEIQKEEKERRQKRAEVQERVTENNSQNEEVTEKPKYPGALTQMRLAEALSFLDLSNKQEQPLTKNPTYPFGYITADRVPSESEYSSEEDDSESESDSDSDEGSESEDQQTAGSNDANDGSFEIDEESEHSEDCDLEEYDTCGDEDLDEAVLTIDA